MSFQRNFSFRIVEEKDSVELMYIWKDKDVTKYTMINNINSVDDCIRRINRQLLWRENDSIGPYVIIQNNSVIGYCGGTKEENNEYEIFYHLSKNKLNQGLGTKIVRELIEIGFKVKNAKAIKARVVIDNIGSYRVLEKNGMTRIKREEKAFEKDGNYFDMYVYEISGKLST